MKNKLLTALLSVVIALGIWLYVVTVVSPNSDKNYYNIPIVTQSEALLHERGLMITEADISAVSLHLEGSRINLNKLNSSNITVTVDVSKIYEVGTHSLTYNVTYPGDVASNSITILNKNPSTITVEVEERITKPIPIEVQYSGTLAENFMADKDNKQLGVENINITGPKSVIDQISVAMIAVDLEGRSESISDQFTYTLCNERGEPVDAQMVVTDVASVNMTLKIMRVKEIALKVNVIEGGGATLENTTIKISSETMWVSGSDNLLEGLDSLELGTINLGDLLTNVTITFPVKLPEGITDESGVTEATVDVILPELTTKTVTVKKFRATNVPAGLNVDIITKALEIQLRGPKNQVEKVKEADIDVTVDFTDAQVGPAKIKAQISCGDLNVGAIGSYTVSATVRDEG